MVTKLLTTRLTPVTKQSVFVLRVEAASAYGIKRALTMPVLPRLAIMPLTLAEIVENKVTARAVEVG